jgi:hypothetical protein
MPIRLPIPLLAAVAIVACAGSLLSSAARTSFQSVAGEPWPDTLSKHEIEFNCWVPMDGYGPPPPPNYFELMRTALFAERPFFGCGNDVRAWAQVRESALQWMDEHRDLFFLRLLWQNTNRFFPSPECGPWNSPLQFSSRSAF